MVWAPAMVDAGTHSLVWPPPSGSQPDSLGATLILTPEEEVRGAPPFGAAP